MLSNGQLAITDVKEIRQTSSSMLETSQGLSSIKRTMYNMSHRLTSLSWYQTSIGRYFKESFIALIKDFA